MKPYDRGKHALRALTNLGVAAELGRPLHSLSGLAQREKLTEPPVSVVDKVVDLLHWSDWRRQHRAIAMFFHYKARGELALLRL